MTEKPDSGKQEPSTSYGGFFEPVCLNSDKARVTDNKATTLSYPLAWGARLRGRLRLHQQHKLFALGACLLIYLQLGIALVLPMREQASLLSFGIIGMLYGIFGWLGCCIATALLPEDVIVIDRLTCILPARNPLLSDKILWSKLDEVSIVDRGTEKACDFNLKLTETSGQEHFMPIKLLAKPDLDMFVGYLQQYAPHTRGLASLAEIDRFYDFAKGTGPQLSYTQLWESSRVAQFGLTSFTPLVPHTVLQGNLTVVRQIAAGGFSAIYLVRDDRGQEFVLKESVLPPGMDEVSKAKATELFQREATILAKLDHQQIARVYDHFVENGRSYLRMEYIKGTTLRAYVSENGARSESEVTGWLTRLAKILAYLHSLTPAVVHRDLTPDNIVVRDDGSIVLIDFGAANEFIGQATGTLIGKHAYMAPEQIRGYAEPASDLYSLGAIGFYCVSGRDPEPIRTASPVREGVKVSERFDALIQKCMALSTEDRIANGDEFIAQAKEAEMETA